MYPFPVKPKEGDVQTFLSNRWQPVTISGDVRLTGAGVISIGANKVTLAHMAQVATATFLGRNTAGTGNVESLSVATVKTLLAYTAADVGAEPAFTAQVKNTFFAGPVTGSNAIPGFRNIYKEDVYPVFGGDNVAGVNDFNDVSNCYPGFQKHVPVGNVTNGPGGTDYFHIMNLEYSSKTGAGNLTQILFPYANNTNNIWMRGRYSSVWGGWVRIWTDNNTNGVVTNTKLANMATQTIKGRSTAGTGAPEDLSIATINSMLGTTYSSSVNVTLPTVTTGWKRIAKCETNQGRGICKVVLETTGGSQSPKQMIIYVNKDWYQVATDSVAGLYTIQAAPDLTYWSGVRLVQEPTGDSCYLEVNFVAASISATVTVYRMGQFLWTVAAGEADSGTSSVRALIALTAGATTHKSQAVDIIPGAVRVTGTLTVDTLTADCIPFAGAAGLVSVDTGLKYIAAGSGRTLVASDTFTDTSGSLGSANATATVNPASASTAQMYGFGGAVQSSAACAQTLTGSTYALCGLYGFAYHFGTNTANKVMGGYFGVQQRVGSGAIQTATGLTVLVDNLNTTVALTNATLINLLGPTDGGGHIGTYKGINIVGTSVGTVNCIGIDIGNMTGVGAFAIRTGTGAVSFGGSVSTTGTITGTQLISNIATGTAPLTIASTTKVINLNADLLDDQEGAYYLAWANFSGVPSTFTPSAHTHAAGDITTGVIAVARLGTGTPDGTKFLRDDGVWATPASGGTPGGSTTQLQYNNAGAFGGTSAIIYGGATFVATDWKCLAITATGQLTGSYDTSTGLSIDLSASGAVVNTGGYTAILANCAVTGAGVMADTVVHGIQALVSFGSTTTTGIAAASIIGGLFDTTVSSDNASGTETVTNIIGLKVTAALSKNAAGNFTVTNYYGLLVTGATNSGATLTNNYGIYQQDSAAKNVWLGRTELAASTTTWAGLNIPHGTAPTTPINGDVWTTIAGLYAQINGVTVGPFAAGGGGSPGGSTTQLQFNNAGTFGGASALTYFGAAHTGTNWSCLKITATGVTTGSDSSKALDIGLSVTPTGAISTADYVGLRIQNTVNNGAVSDTVVKGEYISVSGESNVTTGYSYNFIIGAHYIVSAVANNASGTQQLQNIFGISIDTNVFQLGAGALSVGTFASLHLPAPTILGTPTFANRYGIYQVDPDSKNYFVGSTFIGDAPVSSRLFRAAATITTASIADSGAVDGEYNFTGTTMGSNAVYGGVFRSTHNAGAGYSGAGSIGGIRGEATITSSSSGVVGSVLVFGGRFVAAFSTSALVTATVVNVIQGVRVSAQGNVTGASGTRTIGNISGVYVDNFGVVGNSTSNSIVSVAYGIYTGAYYSNTATTTNYYGIYIPAASGTITNRYGIYSADTAALNYFAGSIVLGTIGKGLRIAEGSNAKMGVATLVAGTVTVNNTSIATTSRIFLCINTSGGTPGFLRVSARTAGTSFTILSSSITDTSVVAWLIIDP